MITPNDVFVYKSKSCSPDTKKKIRRIAKYTQNTWDLKRDMSDIVKSTTIGKVAEDTLRRHISNNSNYLILDYDDFRVDNFKKHAPLDYILYESNNSYIKEAVDRINFDASISLDGSLSNDTKKFMRDFSIYSMEIKSTRLAPRHKDYMGNPDFLKILQDDFLAYPKFCRAYNQNFYINSWTGYHKFCSSQNKIKKDTSMFELRSIELDNMYDFYARVFIEELSSMEQFNIYIIGKIHKSSFLRQSTIKRMVQQDKPQALYIATKLSNGTPFRKS